MNRNDWCTQEDVIKDLAEATGTKIHIDSRFLVVGNKPPPMPVCEPDEDMKLLFGDDFDSKSNNVKHKPMEAALPPDLMGITQMIRMVEDFEEYSSESDSKVCTTRPMLCDLIKISKLNPNIKEFVPKQQLPKSEILSKSGSSKLINEKRVPANGENYMHTDRCENAAVDFKADVNLEKNVDINGQHSNTIRKVEPDSTIDLKQTHSRINNSQIKRQRNVAMANLEKNLPADRQNENINNTAVPKGVKLITPDYYEHPKAVTEDEETLNVLNTENPSSKPDTPLSGYNIIKKFLNSGHIVNNEIASDPELPDYGGDYQKSKSPDSEGEKYFSPESSKEDEIIDPQIRESINKVNSWLYDNNRKPTVKSRADVFSPITFKRKDQKSPNVTEKKTVKSSKNIIEKYQPSEYAEELSRIYMERVKKVEADAHQSSWSNLENILKERDEKIREKQLTTQQNGGEGSK